MDYLLMDCIEQEWVRKNLGGFFASVSDNFKTVRIVGRDDDDNPIIEVGNNIFLCFFNSDATELTVRVIQLLGTDFGTVDTDNSEGIVFSFNKEDDKIIPKKYFIHLKSESQDIYFIDIPEKNITAGTILYHRSCLKGGCTFKSSTIDLKSKVPELQAWIENQLKSIA